ncbi:MAG: FAD-binding domain-containing protein [Pseudomonadota bacterium]
MIHPQINRDQALAGLEAFLPKAGSRYARERNEDRGPGAHDAVSQLSPFLRHRLLTEQEVASAALGAHGRGAEKFIQEVFWRTYFKGHLEHKPSLWAHYRTSLEADLQRYGVDEMAQATLQAALQGETGIEPFDVWLTELKETGYLHNHARMWFASIWIFTLRLPWTIGADLFMQYLLDGDPASNTLSWRWVAGLHTRGKHYLARAENIARYTGNRFGPVGGLNETADPIEEAPLPQATGPADQTLRVTDEPCAALEPDTDGLLLHEEDLHPESFADPLTSLPAAMLPFVDGRASRPCTLTVAAHVASALEDTAQRCSATLLPGNGAETVQFWAQQQGYRRVLTPYAPIGPVQTRLLEVQGALAEVDIELIAVRRHYDAACWPHCKRGFFALKKKIPKLMDAFAAP